MFRGVLFMKEIQLKSYNNNIKPFCKEKFLSPDNCLHPVYFWVWNAKITKEGISKQIDEMKSADIRAFSIIPEPKNFRPNTMVTELEPEYLSEEFMHLLKFAVSYAKENDMQVWFYDEAGWPSGGACGLVLKENPNLARKVLSARKVSLKKGEEYILPKDCVSAFVGENRIFSGFKAPEDTEITEYFRNFISDLFTDIAEKENGERFIKITHEKYKEYLSEYFGDLISICFTDEPANPRPNFVFDFDKIFKEKYGYDILDYTPLLFKRGGSGDTDKENEILRDYYRLCGELLKENFLDPCRKWCHENDILFAGHFGDDHIPLNCSALGRTGIVDALCGMDIPGIDAIWRQIINGGKARDVKVPFFPRVAPSAAHINGTNLALSESFAVYGNGLTFDEMRYTLNYQLVRGINLHSFMIIPYGRERFLHFVERPNFSAEIPGYENLSVFNNYVARASYIGTVGESAIDTALYMPMFDFYAGGEIAEKAYNSYNQMGMNLERKGIEFDLIDDYCIEKAVFEEDYIIIGKAKYKHIYIPENRYLNKGIRESLRKFETESKPNLLSSNSFESLRVLTRKSSDTEYIYFLFNESDEDFKGTITPVCKSDNVYELNMVSGEIYEVLTKAKSFEIELSSGESKAFIVTDKVYETVCNFANTTFQNEIKLTDFTATKKTETVIDKAGLHKQSFEAEFKKIKLGSWNDYFGEAFSGDVVYKTEMCFENEPKKAVIELGKVENSAQIYINGKFVGTVITTPKKININEDFLKSGTNEIEIIVSNSAANAYVLSSADSYFEKREVGCYHDRTKESESDGVNGGLYGPVIIKY